MKIISTAEISYSVLALLRFTCAAIHRSWGCILTFPRNPMVSATYGQRSEPLGTLLQGKASLMELFIVVRADECSTFNSRSVGSCIDKRVVALLVLLLQPNSMRLFAANLRTWLPITTVATPSEMQTSCTAPLKLENPHSWSSAEYVALE